MESFRMAVEMGADAIELDVHLTSDGELAVIHDDALERTTDRAGSVASLTMTQVREANAGYHFARAGDSGTPFRDRGLRIPTLREVLGWLPAGIGLVVEIKARAAVDAGVEALRGSNVHADGGASVISFDEPAIERARELDPSLTTGYLLVPGQPIAPALEWATHHGHTGVHPWEGDLGIDPAPILAQAAAYGRQVGAYVVNDPARMQHLAACGLWGFVTDVPDVARETLGPRQS
jgi:glycerophosphoryl diester phosphodiesterase